MARIDLSNLNLATDKWEAMPDLNRPREGHSSITLNNALYVFGGHFEGCSIERLGIPGTTSAYN